MWMFSEMSYKKDFLIQIKNIIFLSYYSNNNSLMLISFSEISYNNHICKLCTLSSIVLNFPIDKMTYFIIL